MKAADKLRATDCDSGVHLTESDALSLPFPTNTFAFVTVGFGLRNIEDREGGLREIQRVLRPGGCLVILEFSKPRIPVFREIFSVYFKYILPLLGSLISRTLGPYQYLQSSVHRFPSQDELVELLDDAGFREVGFNNLTGGVAALHWGVKND